MPRIAVYYIAISLILGVGTFCYLAFQYGKVCWKIARKKSKTKISAKGDVATILIITLTVILFWIPLLVWYLLNKIKSKLGSSQSN